jgi:hypothetical protein
MLLATVSLGSIGKSFCFHLHTLSLSVSLLLPNCAIRQSNFLTRSIPDLEALQELHRREALGRRAVVANPIIPVPDPVATFSTVTIVGTSYTHTTVPVVATLPGDEPSGPITIVFTETDTECSESTTVTKSLVTVTKCHGGTGCTGLVSGTQTISSSVAEQVTTKTVTQTTCPHLSPCTTKVTTLVTPVGDISTGTGVVPIPTGGNYANTTVTATKTINPGGSNIKSPSGPTTTATSPPQYNGAHRQQAILSHLIMLASFMVLIVKIL